MSRVLIYRSKFYGNQFLNAEATIFLSPSALIRLCCFLGSSQLVEEFTRGSGWVGLHSEHTHAQLKASALSFTAINSHKKHQRNSFLQLAWRQRYTEDGPWWMQGTLHGPAGAEQQRCSTLLQVRASPSSPFSHHQASGEQSQLLVSPVCTAAILRMILDVAKGWNVSLRAPASEDAGRWIGKGSAWRLRVGGVSIFQIKDTPVLQKWSDERTPGKSWCV